MKNILKIAAIATCVLPAFLMAVDLTVTAPDSYDSWSLGTTQTIEWTSTYNGEEIDADSFTIKFADNCPPGPWFYVATVAGDQRTYQWYVGNFIHAFLLPDYYAQIRVIGHYPDFVQYDDSEYFTITR